jgi:hypothetical protein
MNRIALLTLTLLVIPLCGLSFADEKEARENKEALSAGKKVFVEKAEHDVDVAMLGELKKWDWWKVVADESEADLLVRLRVSGSAAWGIGHVQVSVLDSKTKKTLYTSKEQRGSRTIFHGYASPYSRAIDGIVKQMKKDIK